MLEHGRSVILISQDPERVLAPEALAGADAVISVPHPDLPAVRKTIRAVTGGVVRGLVPSDLEGLTLEDLKIAIRPGLTAHDCVMNLRRAALARHRPSETSNVIPLEKLAMTGAVAEWAFATLHIARQVSEGKLDAFRAAPRLSGGHREPARPRWPLPRPVGRMDVRVHLGGRMVWYLRRPSGDVIRAARRFFDEIALSSRPVVGLLDEIDALPNRATMDPSDAQWWTPVITFVLTELDRLRKSGKPVLLLAATNHFNHLDAALIRPGRLEQKVSVLLPDEKERRALFVTCLGDRIGPGWSAILARLAVMATPARIESWCRSAIAKAEIENRPLDLRDLIDLIAPPDGRSPQKDRAVALHEAGHAIVAAELGLPVAEISILSMGAVGGWMKSARDENSLLTRDEIERMGATMGDRAADTVLGGGAHGGAASDIDAVNGLLRTAMVDPALLLADDRRQYRFAQLRGDGISLWTAINVELGRLYDRAAEIVSRRRGDIFRLVEVLLVERVVTGDRLADILGADVSEPPPMTRPSISEGVMTRADQIRRCARLGLCAQSVPPHPD